MNKDFNIIRGTIKEALETIETLNFNGLQINTKNHNGLAICKKALEIQSNENFDKALDFIASNDEGFKFSDKDEKTAYFCKIAKILTEK